MTLNDAIRKLDAANADLGQAEDEVKRILANFIRELYPECEEMAFGVVREGELTHCFYCYTYDDELYIELDASPEVGMPVLTI